MASLLKDAPARAEDLAWAVERHLLGPDADRNLASFERKPTAAPEQVQDPTAGMG